MASVSESPRSARVHMLSQNKTGKKISKKLSKSAPFRSTSKTASSSQGKIMKKDLGMHKLVFKKDGLPNGTEVTYFSGGKQMLKGYKTETGILCHCCDSEISPSQFEAHAGWASHRKPYSYIYIDIDIDNERKSLSLHTFSSTLRAKSEKHAVEYNDDLCTVCEEGGNLLFCDGCPRSFHQVCASLTVNPPGKWYCKFCQKMFQTEKYVKHNANAAAAASVSGVDPIKHIAERCIHIGNNPEEAEVIACVLCSGYNFNKSGFGPHTVILCDQCEKEYHVGCLKKHKMADLKKLPRGKWFCCLDCKRIYSVLQNLLVSGAAKLSDSLLNIIRKKQKDKDLKSVTDMDVRWRLLSAKESSRENKLLLSEAVAIFHGCFDPIVDSVTGRDLIPSMVFGKNVRGQDFRGIYCAILTVNSSVVSAGLLRVFGSDIAELPLVATAKGNQGKGYLRLLFSCVEKLLAFLNVRSFVLPAAEEAESLWIEKFGFQKIPPEQLNNYTKKCWQMISFKGTAMLGKAVPQCEITSLDDAAVFDLSADSQDEA